MGYRSILTVATGAEGLERALETASRLAQAEDGHLDVLALGPDRMQPAIYGREDAIAGMPLTMELAREEAAATEAAVTRRLAQEAPALRRAVDTDVAPAGRLRDIVARRAWFSDLVVLSRPHGPRGQPEGVAVVEAALFEGDAPVLLVPEAILGGATRDLLAQAGVPLMVAH